MRGIRQECNGCGQLEMKASFLGSDICKWCQVESELDSSLVSFGKVI